METEGHHTLDMNQSLLPRTRKGKAAYSQITVQKIISNLWIAENIQWFSELQVWFY